MWKKIFLGLLIVVLVFAGIVAMQPAEYRIERKASVAGKPSVAFAQVNDFHNWPAWSPWAKLDPAMTTTFEGSASGEGAIYKWKGNDKVGEGTMTILESKPNESIRMKLEFIKPFADTCTTEFHFKAEGDKTNVVWTMHGRRDFMGKAVCLFMDLDKMVGGDFEKGLVQLNAVTEEKAKAPLTGGPVVNP